MIQFVKPLVPNRLRMAYNNDVVRFYSTLGGTPAYSDVTIYPGVTVRLYPDPNGRFYFNFRPYISTFINTANFEDTTETNLTAEDPDSFVYSAMNNVATQRNVTFAINMGDAGTDTASYTLTWLAAAQQIGSYTEYNINNLLVLSPALPDAANTWYLKYWEGYPFDFSVFSNVTGMEVINTTNLVSASLNVVGYGDRVFLSDGRTDETLEDFLPLAKGYNTLKLLRENDSPEDAKFIQLEKAAPCDGVYLKWRNAQGGYSYWLFENTYAVDRNAKSLGELNRDFENPENSFGNTTQVGREVQDTLKIVAELLTPSQRDIVQNLLESPKVYLFTGKPYSRSDYRSWIEVSVKTTSARIKNPRESLTNFAFDIELPVRYTVSL